MDQCHIRIVVIIELLQWRNVNMVVSDLPKCGLIREIVSWFYRKILLFISVGTLIIVSKF